MLESKGTLLRSGFVKEHGGVSDIEFRRAFGEGICRECNVRSQPESKLKQQLLAPGIRICYASALEHHFMRPQECPQVHEATCYSACDPEVPISRWQMGLD
jgi:hypothetical protein